MKATRYVLVVALAAVAMAAGCEKKYTLKISNVTSEIQNVQILEQGIWAESAVSVAPDGGKESVVIKQDEDESTAFTLKANTHSTQFTISKNSLNPMYFHITPNGIIGPVGKGATVSEKWEIKKETRTEPREIIE